MADIMVPSTALTVSLFCRKYGKAKPTIAITMTLTTTGVRISEN